MELPETRYLQKGQLRCCNPEEAVFEVFIENGRLLVQCPICCGVLIDVAYKEVKR